MLNQYQYVNMSHANTESTRQCKVSLSKQNLKKQKKTKKCLFPLNCLCWTVLFAVFKKCRGLNNSCVPLAISLATVWLHCLHLVQRPKQFSPITVQPDVRQAEALGRKHSLTDGIHTKAVAVDNYIRSPCLSQEASKDEIRPGADCLERSCYIMSSTVRLFLLLERNSELYQSPLTAWLLWLLYVHHFDIQGYCR